MRAYTRAAALIVGYALSLGAAVCFSTGLALADVVEAKSGARLTGKIVKIDGSAVTLETD